MSATPRRVAEEYAIISASTDDRPFVPSCQVVTMSALSDDDNARSVLEGMRWCFRKWDDRIGSRKCIRCSGQVKWNIYQTPLIILADGSKQTIVLPKLSGMIGLGQESLRCSRQVKWTIYQAPLVKLADGSKQPIVLPYIGKRRIKQVSTFCIQL